MIRNFTPHEIVVRIDEKELRFPSEGIARVKVNQVEGIPIDGIPVNLQEFGEVEGLPEPEKGVFLIVSGIVLNAVSGIREDCVAPDTGSGAIRNDKGQIVAVKGFIR